MIKDNKNILIVETDEYMRETLVDILEMDDFNITTAKDGKDAWLLYEKMHFDLIIMDVILSDLERLRLLMEYKDIDPETEVLAIPGQFIFDKNECMNMNKVLGSDCVLEQPFDIDELKDRAKFLLEKKDS